MGEVSKWMVQQVVLLAHNSLLSSMYSFACSTCGSTLGLLSPSHFPPTPPKTCHRWAGYSNLPLCVHSSMWWTGVIQDSYSYACLNLKSLLLEHSSSLTILLWSGGSRACPRNTEYGVSVLYLVVARYIFFINGILEFNHCHKIFLSCCFYYLLIYYI